ncbi:dolichyl-diphosphooligosaccharide--protein glycosyltransferase subunit 2-like [Planoprotostelium fungivorum]|uniref:Ribophorin II n=1 Tax=Planoprotostelium fungivorum TaxID=1890364 RepID=A0A2P6MRU4_9EUKA|nr:dolichyl-diphosphooligosaccharide--protein glycosyltransferase subunit 2-like [Planoprotostelium fungivorum]
MIGSVLLLLVVLAAATANLIQDVTFTVSNSADTKDTKSISAEYPGSFKTELNVGEKNKLNFEITLKKTDKKKQNLHQLFVRISSTDDKYEFIAPAKTSSGVLQASFSASELSHDVNGSGTYNIQILAGDASLPKPIVWNVGKLSLDASNLDTAKVDPFVRKPEIYHKFRVAERRPPTVVSSAFTLAVLAPALVLFGGWTYVGANLRNFPGGTASLAALGFHACLGAVLLLFIVYWLSLTMMTTLIYAGILAVPSAYFAHQTLNALARNHEAAAVGRAKQE